MVGEISHDSSLRDKVRNDRSGGWFWWVLRPLLIVLAMVSLGQADADSAFNQGLSYHENGLYGASLLQFERFLETYPDDARHSLAVLYIGKAHYHQKQYAQAEEILEKLWREDRTPYFRRYIDDLFSYLIESKINQGKVDEADQLTQSYSLRYWYPSEYINILFRIAEAWYLEGNYDRARRFLRKMDELDAGAPHAIYANYLRGMMAIAEERYDEAERYLKTVISTPTSIHNEPDEVAMLKDQARLKLADLYFQQEQYEAAFKRYRAIENLTLWGDRRYLGMAWSSFMVIDYMAAIENAQKLIVEYPESIYHGEAEFIQAVSYLDTDDPVFAVLHFENFLELLQDYETEAQIDAIQAEIADEYEQVARLRADIQELEEMLVYLPESRTDDLVDRILKRREQLTDLEQSIQTVYDRLDQRKIEMQLKVEAEYGLNKAKLLSTRPEPK